MPDFIVKSSLNGRPVFSILFDPGPNWQKKFFGYSVIEWVERTDDLQDLTLDRLGALHKEMPTAKLEEIVTKFRMDQEFGCLKPIPRPQRLQTMQTKKRRM
jgi:hypothetical protein